MKTSLLLTSLALAAGLVGTAQAASTTAATSTIPNIPSSVLVTTSVSSDSVLSELGEWLAAKATTKQATAQPCDHDVAHVTDKPKPCPGQGAVPPASANPHEQRAASSTDAPRSSGDGNALPSSASSAEAALGWQSLLPGSIQ